MTMNDPEYYKRLYGGQWKRHADNVNSLRDDLIQRLPVLQHSIRTGLGADSPELVQVPPHEKDEADLEVFYNYELLCHIEVSGSASRNVRVPPEPIYIRVGKLELAKEKEDAGEPYFFWMVYHDATWVVRSTDAWPHRGNAVTKNWYGANERYFEIPASLGQSPDGLFDWIAERVV